MYIYMYIYIHIYICIYINTFASPFYRGSTSLIRTPPPAGPYSSPTPRDLW